MVYHIQSIVFLQKVVSAGIYYLANPVPDTTEPEPVDESVVQRNGRLGHLGNSERGKAADDRVH